MSSPRDTTGPPSFGSIDQKNFTTRGQRKVLRRVRRELGGAHTCLEADEQLLRETSPAWEELGSTHAAEDASLLVPVRFRRDGTRLALFTTIATLGTPLDVTLQELRIEMLFPADEPTRKALHERAR